MPFQNANAAAGLPVNGPVQIGLSDADDDANIEQGILLPVASDPAGSYVYYDCTVGVMLDSGMVVHNRLPQVNNASDTLASVGIDDPNLDQIAGPGVNLRCADQYADIVQRMGHARYWFRLWGQALRVGYQIPIPGIRTIGGAPVVPYDRNPAWAYNRIFPGGNYGGLVLWHAAWSLWYTTAAPTANNTIPAVDAAAHASNNTPLPQGVQAPYSAADDNAVQGIAPVVAKR